MLNKNNSCFFIIKILLLGCGLAIFTTHITAQNTTENNIETLRTKGYNLRFTDTVNCIAWQMIALQQAKSTAAIDQLVAGYAMLSLTYKKLSSTAKAQLYADSSFYLSQQNKTPYAQGYAYMATGLLKYFFDDDKQAMEDLIKAYGFFSTINNSKYVSQIAADISYLYATNKVPVAQVEKYASIALQQAEVSKLPDVILYARLAYGSWLIAKKRSDSTIKATVSINYFNETIDFANRNENQIFNKSNLAIAYINLAVTYHENSTGYSEILFLKALDSAVKYAARYNIRTVYRNSLGLKGEYYVGKKAYVLAEKLFKDGITYQKTLPFPDFRIFTLFYSSLKDLALRQKNYKAYYEYDSSFVKYNQLQFDEAKQKAMQNADARYESSLKATKIGLLEKENKLQRNNKWLGFGAAALLALTLFLLILYYYFRQKYYLQSENVLKEKQRSTELSLKVKEQEAMESLAQKLSMERRLLQSQMDPHFVFNALGNIQSFVLQNETQHAVAYLSTFSKLMRQILLHSKQTAITLADEIATLKNYIELQKLRLNHRFKYFIEVDDLLDVQNKIPPMLIQPFIENAIEHGLKPLGDNKEGELKIYFSDDEQNECLVCIIKDNGIGYQFSKQAQQNNKQHQSMGTAITKERLDQLITKNNCAGFSINEIKSKNGDILGTEVIIKIPYYNA